MNITFQRIRGSMEAANAKTSWNSRESLILRLEDGARVGRGEAAPLPGYSNETLDECEAALRSGEALPPAAEFAWQSAHAELRGISLPSCPPLPLATLGADADGAVFKCKIGRDLESELSLAKAQTRPVRFDANGALGVDAPAVLARLADLGAEFIEEPVPFEDLAALAPSPVPIALDESLQGENGVERLEEALARGWAHVLVVKPMALGPRRAEALCETAKRHGAPIVVSHLFGGPIAYAACARFAFRFATREIAQGLGRHAGLRAFPRYSTSLASGGMLEPWEGREWPVRESA